MDEAQTTIYRYPRAKIAKLCPLSPAIGNEIGIYGDSDSSIDIQDNWT